MGEESGSGIEVSGIDVEFPIYHGNSRSLKRRVFAAASGRLQEDARHRIVVQAVRGVTFQLRRGERLGLIGHNGAGKTTLLRTLAGIYEPVVGQVRVRGSICALLDINLGMNPEMTGRENIVLRGLTNGLNRAEIQHLEADVQDFAELAEFLDLPLRFYSSGMVVRLGFALATAIRPQVLLMDEWILAGDAAFMEKAKTRLESMVRGADVLVLSSHSPQVILDWCTRVIWMDQGRIRADGPAAEIAALYAAAQRGEVVQDADAMLQPEAGLSVGAAAVSSEGVP